MDKPCRVRSVCLWSVCVCVKTCRMNSEIICGGIMLAWLCTLIISLQEEYPEAVSGRLAHD